MGANLQKRYYKKKVVVAQMARSVTFFLGYFPVFFDFSLFAFLKFFPVGLLCRPLCFHILKHFFQFSAHWIIQWHIT
jgi:hypothetical protein